MASTKTKPKAPIVYATESFIAVVHQDPVELGDIRTDNFELKLDDRDITLDEWTPTYLPHLNTTLLFPPEGQTVVDAAGEPAKQSRFERGTKK
jgi:hypothetical protein